MSLPTYADLRNIYTGVRFRVVSARREDGARVAIKQPLPWRPESKLAERLRHEHQVLGNLDVRGVPRSLDFTTTDGRPSLVLEDAGPRNLAECLRGRPLAIDAFLRLAVRMATIVGAIHERSLIHRDICPENFVAADDLADVALVDFETATAVPAFREAPGLPGELEGTLAYMAPEQTGRMKRLVDRRADLYALGATFYEMLTGQPPFSTRDPLELVRDHAARAPYPPAIVNSAVPTVLSNIVAKLLAKMPEWRYQTAAALAADLQQAERQWQVRGAITTFELGLQDLPYGLFLESGNLYGREHETKVLADSAERVAATGTSEVLLVSGPAGIGKSALVHSLREVAWAKYRWAAGKGDMLRGNVPYAPLVEAFRGLVQALLREPEDDLRALRERVRRAATPNGRVLVEAIPDLEALLGEQPPVASVGAVEAENRFHLVFADFLRALLADGLPVVLFVDDLEWIDAASLKLLRAVAADPEVRSLFIVGAYRSEEVGPDHPVLRTMDLIRTAGARVETVELGALDSDSLLALLCDALRVEPGTAARLAEVVRRKTAGNPFFVRQFLGYLYRTQLLVFDIEHARWAWDLPGIEAAEVTPNVVDLLSKVIDTLPEEAQGVLRAAACIGNRFDLSVLAGLRNEPMDVSAKALWAPIQQGLIAPAVEGPQFTWAASKPAELGTAIAPTFRFVHDRVREAAYELLSEEKRKALHLRIGRLLEESVPEAAFHTAVGPIVDHLNRAVELLSEPERTRLATLNERAGKQARATAAYDSALGYFQAGLGLLPPEAWRGELHSLWFSLQRSAAECAGLTGAAELCDSLVDGGIARTDALLEKADFYATSVQANARRGQHAQAIQRCLEGLSVLGVNLPREPTAEVVSAERRRARSILGSRSDRLLLEAPPMDDPVERAKLQLLVDLSSAWFIAPELFQIVGCRAAELTATKGVAPGAAVAYVYYAIGLAMVGQYEDSHRYGRIGAELAERMGDPAEECRALLAFGGHVLGWRAPISESVPMLQRSYARGLASGDLEFAAYALADLVFQRMFVGTELSHVLAEAESALSFYRKIHNLSGMAYVQPFAQAVKSLKGLTREPASFDDDRFDEARFLDEAAQNGLAQAVFHVLRLEASYLLGRPDLAQKYAMSGAAWLPYLRTLFLRVDFHFYASLTCAAVSQTAGPKDRDELVAELRKHLHKLETWSKHAPANYLHKHDLAAAELAGIEGRSEEALTLYHRAIEQAASGEFRHDEALAHELCGRFHLVQGSHHMAELHLGVAMDRYRLWGASAKVELLNRELPSLGLRAPVGPISARAPAPALDYYSLAKASETLTEELVFERLLVKLVRTCAEAAEAERAVLVLDEGGLVSRATATAAGEVMLDRRPLDGARSVPTSVVEHVFASRQVLVLGDAVREGRYTKDPYVLEHGVRSILAVPIVRANKVHGVLYFENNLATYAFTPERAEMFRLLSAQMAIALENSRLFEERERSEAAGRLLSQASAQLTETLDYREVLAKIGPAFVPAFADWCIVDAMEKGVLAPVAWAHADPSEAPKVEELHRRYPVDASSTQPQGEVLRSKRSVLVPEVTDEALRTAARDDENLRLARALHPRSGMVIPLVAHGRSIGVVSLVSSHPTRRYDQADLALAEELVRRIGLALDNARLYRDLQDAMRDREQRHRQLRMVFRHLPGAVWAMDRALRITHATGRLVNVEGLDERQVVGISGYEFLGTHDPTDAWIAHQLAALSGEKQSFEYRFHGRWYAVLVDPLRDRKERIVGCVGAAFDITEQKELISKLEQAVSRWEATINATAEGILAVDLEQGISAVNQRFLSLWQAPPRAGQHLHHLELLSPVLDQLEDREAFIRKTEEIYAHKEQESFDAIRFRDGRVFERYSTPQRFGDEITGRVWSIRDVTERERLLHRAVFLADAARLLGSLDVEQALDGVAHLAVPYLGDGCAIDLFGDGDPRRLIAVSRDPRKPISPEVHPTVLGGNSIIYRLASTSYLGVPLLVQGYPIGAITLAAPRHRKYTATDVDLAEELARRAALAIANARLYRRASEALRARDEFLSIAAHEIRGPVHSIHMSVQAIEKGKANPDSMSRLFEIVERQDRRLSRFVDELLDLGRIRAGRFQLEYQDVNLGDVVRDVATRLGPDLAHSGSSLTVSAHGQVVGQWDKSRVDQIVSNLVSNAIKFGLGKPIEVGIGARAGRARLVVRDQGMGIEAELRKRLFKPFERGVSVRHYGGLGLGLHIVKTIVDALGGLVRVESAPGSGTTFTVELPQTRLGVERDAHPSS